MTTLYLVPTPLGDPDDITLRAVRILREASAVAAENPLITQALLDHHGITTPIIAYTEVLDALSDGDVALVAEAGTPGIGDDAAPVVRAAIERGVRVEPLPGASAEITALVLSGLPTDAFVYVGNMPDDATGYASERETMIFTTSDMPDALARLRAALGERAVCVASRLTQANEVVYRGRLDDAIDFFRDRIVPDAGDRTSSASRERNMPETYLLVVGGAEPVAEAAWDEMRVRTALRDRIGAGEALKDAAKAVAKAAGWDRRAVYALGVDEKGNSTNTP